MYKKSVTAILTPFQLEKDQQGRLTTHASQSCALDHEHYMVRGLALIVPCFIERIV
jgi:hypothetical protein